MTLPILFNREMVQAILNGHKMQTRRPMNPQPDCEKIQAAYTRGSTVAAYALRNGIYSIRCPFGQVGDELWVRETAEVYAIERGRVYFEYTADGVLGECCIPERIKPRGIGKKMSNGCFKEAARIHLRVNRIWVERVQEISDADAWAEGVFADLPYDMDPPHDAVSAFLILWDSIYKSADANPYVWACEFERIAK